MPVDSTNEQYDALLPIWHKCRVVIAGEEAVHAAGGTYLPRLKEQSDDEYRAYKSRAGFYNATQRTLDSLSGMIFSKPPVFELPARMDGMLDDADMGGQTLQGFAENLVDEVLAVGRAFVLTDYPDVIDAPTSATQAEASDIRPYLRLYKAESVIDWHTQRTDNRVQLTQVRLSETVDEPLDEFTVEPVEQIRVLDTDTGVYRMRVYQKRGASWEIVSEVVPLSGGRPLRDIPGVFFGPRDLSADAAKPPMLDMINVNLSHYRTMADLEHGAHFTALPTPYLFGINPDEAPAGIGPTVLWTSQNPEAKTGLVEYTGQGLKSLEARREAKEQAMSALGARLLMSDKKATETAETARIHRAGETSVLSSVAQAISLGLTQALVFARDWAGLSGEVRVELNRDYSPVPMAPQMLRELLAALQGGAISYETFFVNLQRGDLIAADRTAEEEQEAAQEPALGAIGADDGGE